MSLAGQPGSRRGSAQTLLGLVLFVLSVSVSLAAETRIALVIGNGTYREAPLKNPPEDASLIADTLKGLGFTLIGAKPLIDADQKTMKRAIRSFGEQLERAGSGGVGLFFYAGHAVQANGKNYLIPVGADIRGEADLEDDAVFADSVLARMTYAGARMNLVVLDACRNNPYRGRFRSPTRGLAEMSAPYGSLGSFVAYSTAPGDVAEDGTGKNSPYSAALAEAMGIAGMPVELAFKQVRSVVMQATGNRQVPWESSSLIGDFYFKQTSPAVGKMTPKEIASAYSGSTVLIESEWRLLERQSGKQVVLKRAPDPQTGFGSPHYRGLLPAYVHLKDERGEPSNPPRIVPWLMLDNEGPNNEAIRQKVKGSGFVVRHDGFILTNRHVATPWDFTYYFGCECTAPLGLLYEEDSAENVQPLYYPGNDWIPTQETILFNDKRPTLFRERSRRFFRRAASI